MHEAEHGMHVLYYTSMAMGKHQAMNTCTFPIDSLFRYIQYTHNIYTNTRSLLLHVTASPISYHLKI